jgi:hypothetical protein
LLTLRRPTVDSGHLGGTAPRLQIVKIDARTAKRKNLGTFDTREAAEKHERAVQYFKHH